MQVAFAIDFTILLTIAAYLNQQMSLSKKF